MRRIITTLAFVVTPMLAQAKTHTPDLATSTPTVFSAAPHKNMTVWPALERLPPRTSQTPGTEQAAFLLFGTVSLDDMMDKEGLKGPQNEIAIRMNFAAQQTHNTAFYSHLLAKYSARPQGHTVHQVPAPPGLLALLTAVLVSIAVRLGRACPETPSVTRLSRFPRHVKTP